MTGARLLPMLLLCSAVIAGVTVLRPALAQTPAASAPLPLSAEQVRQDLDALYDNLRQGHYDLFAYRDEEAYQAFYQGLRSAIAKPLDRAEAAALYQRLAAFGRIGHASTDAPAQEFVAHMRSGGRFVPLFARVETDGRIVLTRTADLSATVPAGAELIAIDGEPAIRWLNRLSELVSAERAYMAYARLEELLPALLWVTQRSDDPLPVRLRIAGRIVDTAIAPVSFAEFGAIGTAHPAARHGIDFRTRDARMLGDGIAYLRPGPFGALPGDGDTPIAAFEAFLAKAFAEFMAAGASDLILDLRNNSGGDNSFSDPMIAWFANKPFRFSSNFRLRASAPTKAQYDSIDPGMVGRDTTLARLIAAERSQPNGTRYPFEIALVPPRAGQRYTSRVWVLVNRHSYSNAASVAAIVQDYGFGTIIGEETADLPTTFASIVEFTLPNSGFRIAYPKSYFIRPSGDERIRGVVPDIALSRETVPTAEDAVLQAARLEIAKSRIP